MVYPSGLEPEPSASEAEMVSNSTTGTRCIVLYHKAWRLSMRARKKRLRKNDFGRILSPTRKLLTKKRIKYILK